MVIDSYIKSKRNKIVFAIQKFVNKNEEKKAYILKLIRSEFENDETQMMNDILFRKLFQAFIISKNPWDINETFTYLKCYDMCLESLQKSRHIFNMDFINEFIKCTPTYKWEMQIENCFKSSFLENRKTIENLKSECERKVKMSFEMRKFMQALNPKIRLSNEQQRERDNAEISIDKILILMRKVKKVDKPCK